MGAKQSKKKILIKKKKQKCEKIFYDIDRSKVKITYKDADGYSTKQLKYSYTYNGIPGGWYV